MSRRTEARNLDLDLEQRENEAMQSQDDSTDTENEASTPRGSKTSSVSRKSNRYRVCSWRPMGRS